MTPWLSPYLPIVWVGGHLSAQDKDCIFVSALWKQISPYEFLLLGWEMARSPANQQQVCISFRAEAMLLTL